MGRQRGLDTAQQQSDFLDVLRRSCQQTLFTDIGQAAHPCIAVSMKLLGVGEAAFHGFLAPLINLLAPRLQTMAVHSIPRRLPDMPRYHLHHVLTTRALSPQRTLPSGLRSGVVLPISLPVAAAILQQLRDGTDI